MKPSASPLFTLPVVTADQFTMNDLQALIQNNTMKRRLAGLATPFLSVERLVWSASAALNQDPRLTAIPVEALLRALQLCARAGLEPDGRHALLQPLGDQVLVRFLWPGLVKLAHRYGVRQFACDLVQTRDHFEWRRTGTGLQFRHQVDFRQPRGELCAAYCLWKEEGHFTGEVLTQSEVTGLNQTLSVDTTTWPERVRQTVLRRSTLRWPLPADVAAALAEAEAGWQAAMQTAAQPPRPITPPLFPPDPSPAPADASHVPVTTGIIPPPLPTTTSLPITAQAELELFLVQEHGIAFSDFQNFIHTKNLAADARLWKSWSEVPLTICRTLKTQLKLVAELVRRHGKAKN